MGSQIEVIFRALGSCTRVELGSLLPPRRRWHGKGACQAHCEGLAALSADLKNILVRLPKSTPGASSGRSGRRRRRAGRGAGRPAGRPPAAGTRAAGTGVHPRLPRQAQLLRGRQASVEHSWSAVRHEVLRHVVQESHGWGPPTTTALQCSITESPGIETYQQSSNGPAAQQHATMEQHVFKSWAS